MFSGKIARSLKSIAVRLTAWYAGIFTLSILLIFVAIYLVVWSSLMKRADEDLREEYREMLMIAQSGGREAIEEGLRREAQLDGVENLFLRLVAVDGGLVMSSDLSYWQDLDEMRMSQDGSGGAPALQTVTLPGREFPLRVLSTPFGDGKTLQIGMSLEKDRRLMGQLGEIAVLVLIVAFSGAVVVGWFMARRALAGVEAVRTTALEISRGAFERRVPTRGSGDEIDRLADTFNLMVGQIEKLIREMHEFSDNLAHDLRAPITRIRGTAETALTRNSNMEEYNASLGTTIEECDRLLALVNTLLDLSELEAGTSRFNQETIGIDELILDIGELFVPAAQAQGVALELQPGGGGDVFGDRRSLQRALANLIDNAMKFTPAGGKVTLSSAIKGKCTCITITDSGRGISPSQLPHVFDRFHRGDQSRSEPGNGLGLCLSKALIEAHGGKISVESALNQGSIFTLTLPLQAGGNPA